VKGRLLAWGVAGWLGAVVWAAPPLHVLQRSVSVSHQFILYSDDRNLRVQVSSFCEDVKGRLLAYLGVPDRWKVPIVVRLERALANDPGRAPSQVGWFETEDGAKLELTVVIGENPADVDFQHQLLRALLLELAYRDRPPRAGTEFTEPPSWLIDGLEAGLGRQQEGPDPGVFRALVEASHPPALQDFLRESPPPRGSASRALYEAYATALVHLLTHQPEGRGGLISLLKALPRWDGDWSRLLTGVFPSLGAGGQSMEKWWALSIARLAAADRFRPSAPEETDRRLGELLSFSVVPEAGGAPVTYTLDQVKELARSKAARTVLTDRIPALVELEMRSHPVYRPVIAEYRTIIELLARGKTRHLAERIAKVGEQRAGAGRRLEAITDYLNWFEATETAEPSRAFAGYFKAAAEEEETTARRRTDHISAYLDQLEGELEK
jgi:hypothetical protein